MMRMRTKNDALPPQVIGGDSGGGGREKEWELRPGGMLVQTRTDTNQNHVPSPTIRVRVKYGPIYHEVRINSQATFGELKKMLTAPTGLHHEDQKLFYKHKERNSKAFLDIAGVKDKSKIVLQEDPISQEKRLLEMRKNVKMEKAAKSISEISFEVDRLAGEVSALETVISKGGKVADKNVINVMESLMNQLIKLEGIIADGDVKLQRKTQVQRVQKYVETLDMLKVKNSMATSNGTGEPLSTQCHQQQQGRVLSEHSLIGSSVEQQPTKHSASVVITTQWETFDSIQPASMAGGPSTSTSTIHPCFTWDLL